MSHQRFTVSLSSSTGILLAASTSCASERANELGDASRACASNDTADDETSPVASASAATGIASNALAIRT
jgi:hypothetical protein